jgi:hypothetical protein
LGGKCISDLTGHGTAGFRMLAAITAPISAVQREASTFSTK